MDKIQQVCCLSQTLLSLLQALRTSSQKYNLRRWPLQHLDGAACMRRRVAQSPRRRRRRKSTFSSSLRRLYFRFFVSRRGGSANNAVTSSVGVTGRAALSAVPSRTGARAGASRPAGLNLNLEAKPQRLRRPRARARRTAQWPAAPEWWRRQPADQMAPSVLAQNTWMEVHSSRLPLRSVTSFHSRQ